MLPKNETFGSYLRRLRIDCGKKQSELAVAIGKTVMYISNIENGKNSPPATEQLTKIADVLQLALPERNDFFDQAAITCGTIASDIREALEEKPVLKKIVRKVQECKISSKECEELLDAIDRRQI